MKEKAAVVQADPAAEIVTLDFSKTEEIQAVTEKVSTKIQEQGIATKEDFDAVKADLDVAVTNVNTKINEVTDLTSEDPWLHLRLQRNLRHRSRLRLNRRRSLLLRLHSRMLLQSKPHRPKKQQR